MNEYWDYITGGSEPLHPEGELTEGIFEGRFDD